MEESRGRCWGWLRRRVPPAHQEEACRVLSLTGPLLLARILDYLLPFVVTMFCGRLGNNVMAGYGLACATFGSKNLPRVGVILQRSILILLLFCLPCWGLLLNTQAILLCAGQVPEVARIAHVYVTAYLPAVPGIIRPQVYMAALANLANLLTNFLLVSWLDLGLKGSAAANSLSAVYLCTFMFLYTWRNKLHVSTWRGWSAESLQEWGSYMRLAMPSVFMTCFEWWIFEFGGFLAGLLGENELAAQHALMMVSFLNYMIPLGIQAAACGFAVVECIVLASTKSVIGRIFTSDETIVALVSHMMGVYCVIPLFDQSCGFWIGLLVAVCIQSLFYVITIFNFNWETMTAEAVKRGKKNMHVAPHSETVPLNPETSADRGVDDNNEHNGGSVNGRISDVVERPGGGSHLVQRSSSSSSEVAPPGPRKRLSTAQLILRRGFTAAAMVLLLALGVGVHCLMPLPETAAAASVAINPSERNLTLGWSNTTDTTPAPVPSTTWVTHM
ncbi:hypothetical protein CRUP_033505 [Coryphaenoides rupestris]|nr:hypothetical protein CRUP_033505 [Coryphaenoides rupestris]